MTYPDCQLTLSRSELAELAAAQGIRIFGVSSPDPLSQREEAVKRWQERGLNASMKWFERAAGGAFRASAILEGVCSVVSFFVPNVVTSRHKLERGFGRIARFANDGDYHRVLGEKLSGIVAEASRRLGGRLKARVLCDSVPFLEKESAERAGLGYVGKNTLLIVPGFGSFGNLGEILWNVKIEPVAAQPPVEKRCQRCSACLNACPTGALTDYVLDARKCISYLTIEKSGFFSREERTAIGEWVFGCDLCQETCPENHAQLVDVSEAGDAAAISLLSLLTTGSETQFRKTFGERSFNRRGRAAMLRNACCVAANTGCVELLEVLIDRSMDQSPVVRGHALWAASVIARKAGNKSLARIKEIAQVSGNDKDVRVSEIADEILEDR